MRRSEAARPARSDELRYLDENWNSVKFVNNKSLILFNDLTCNFIY